MKSRQNATFIYFMTLGLFICLSFLFLLFKLYALCTNQPAIFLEDHSTKIAQISSQLDALETKIKEKETNFPILYDALLRTQGKYKCQTIVAENASRLRLDDVRILSLGTSRQGPDQVSRHSAPRYSASTFDITCISGATAHELNRLFASTPLEGLGEAFIRAEEENQINALFLASIAIIESNWGASGLAREKNNLFGFGAYTNAPDSAVSFSSKSDCIFHVAQFLRQHYIDGNFYRGRSIADINKLYAADTAWSEKVFSTMLRLDARIQENTKKEFTK